MPPPLNSSSEGLRRCLEYVSPQGVLLPRVYGTFTSPLWLELRGLSALQATPSWTVYRLACTPRFRCPTVPEFFAPLLGPFAGV